MRRMANEILRETRGPIGILRINRPDKLNALNMATMDQIVAGFEHYESDAEIRCTLIAGSDRAFAAGADIGEMADASMVEMYHRNQFAKWERIRRIQKPIVAAVSGYVLGGGCELMMHCDIIIAAESARIGQPEINIGVMPGAGGTQRLAQAIGKARTMELVLTGRFVGAEEALRIGLVNRVVPVEAYLDEAKRLAREIAGKPPIAVELAKQAVNSVFDDYLDRGLLTERRLFYLLFGTEDQAEGMRAFLDKRPPVWTGR